MIKAEAPILAENLKKYGISYQQVADILGYKARSTISRKINGKRGTFSIDQIQVLCNELDKDYYELFTNEKGE